MFPSVPLYIIFTFISSFCCAIPEGFIDEGVVARNAILTGAFAPNPRNNGKPMLLLSSKGGQVYVLEDPDNSDDNIFIFDLDGHVCVNGERGLQSVLPHPDFINNQYIYMYFSSFVDGCAEDAKVGPPNHLSRFTMDKETLRIDIDSEMVILETSPGAKFMHNGGAMAFGNDGMLYLTIGDGGIREPPNAQDLSILFGKVIRIDENGIAPRDNPFTVESGGTGVPCAKNGGVPPPGSPDEAVCEEIYSYGLRNPFRLAMDVNTKDKVLFHVGDVGASHWEEISEGGSDYKGANYGWPIHEGPCKIATTDDCPVVNSFINPIYYYQHIKLAEGGCVTGAAFVPDGLWPEQYKYLFIDFIYGNIYNLIEDQDRACRDCIPPIPAYHNETFYSRDKMVDIFFGPYKDTQAMYVISRNEGQSIRRIRYTGSSNRAPVANITSSMNHGGVNDVIVFNGSGSSDPDGDDISYLWDFGDGTTANEEIPEHSFSERGEYTVTLTVEDKKHQTNQDFVLIVIGAPPVASMQSPASGDEFEVGQVLRVIGDATDSIGKILSDSQISWEVRQHHEHHFHPFLDRTQGNDFDLDPAPDPEDFLAATTSYLEVIMYATDDNGLTTTVSRNIQPKKVILDIDSSPQGLQVLVDEFPVVTPANITSWVNHKLRLNVDDQGHHVFDSWSINGNRKTTYKIPDDRLKSKYILATFKNDSEPEISGTNTSTPSFAPTKVFTTASPVISDIEIPTFDSNMDDDTAKPTTPVKTNIPTKDRHDNDDNSDNPTNDDNKGDDDFDLVPLVTPTKDCSPDEPCHRCEGDCDTNDDCVGDLVCYSKGRGDPDDDRVVPGCIGIDTSKTDWCTTKDAVNNQ
jgi:PKD repeat protein